MVNALRPGFRMAGGLTGAILGGALGAGTAAVMRQDNPAAANPCQSSSVVES